MFTVAITLMNGHSVNVRATEEKDAIDIVSLLSKEKIVHVKLRSGESVYIFSEKVAYVTLYKEEAKK